MIQTTLGIEGMACEMCEAHINNVIRKNLDVKSVKANRRKNSCIVISETELDEEAVRTAITGIGYELTSFRSEPYQQKGLFSR